VDDYDSGDGKTFYVGDKKSEKQLRVYEKGREQGDRNSPRVRYEAQFRNSNGPVYNPYKQQWEFQQTGPAPEAMPAQADASSLQLAAEHSTMYSQGDAGSRRPATILAGVQGRRPCGSASHALARHRPGQFGRADRSRSCCKLILVGGACREARAEPELQPLPCGANKDPGSAVT
jgi:hypothetical protein